MKSRLLLLSLLGLLSLTACGGGNSTTSGDTSKNDTTETTPDKPDVPQVDHTLGPNDFLEDEDTTDDNVLIEDTTPLDKGELKDNIFEFESAEFEGISKQNDHVCLTQSWCFHTEFSGNVALKNIHVGSIHRFKFTSSKAVRVPVEIGLSTYIREGQAFGSNYDVYINDTDWAYTSALLPKGGKQPTGLNNPYFTMNKLTIEVSLKEGDNVLEFINKSSDCPNLDYMNLKTSAKIVNKTVSTWPRLDDVETKLITVPTETSGGEFQYTCRSGKHAAAPQTSHGKLPALTAENYEIVHNEDEDSYRITTGSESFAVIGSYRLTATGGTFDNGKDTKKFAKGEKVVINYTAPEGKALVGWENTSNPKETFEPIFNMPNHPLTVKPILEKAQEFTLKLINAKFEDGTTSKSVVASSMPKIITSPKKGYKLVGFATQDKETYFEGSNFIMPKENITIMPIYDLIDYASQGKIFNGITPGDRENYVFKHDQPIANVRRGIVGDELNGILLEESFDKGQDIEVKNHITIQSSHTYNLRFKFENRGETDITFKLNQFTRWAEGGTETPNSVFTKDACTIKPGEVKEFSIQFGGWNNKNIFTRIYFQEAVANCKLGFIQYLTIVK